MVSEVLGCFAGGGPEFRKQLGAVEHLLNRVWAQESEIDAVQLLRRLSPVASGPLASIANGSYAAQIHGRDKDALILVLDKV